MALRYEPAVGVTVREARAGGISVSLRLRSMSVTVALAVAIAALAFNGGGYALGVRAPVGIAVWWAVGLGIALGLWPRTRLPRPAVAAFALLTALAVLAVVSVAWGDSAEAAL